MVDVDLSQPPFSLLDERGRDRVRGGIDLASFDQGEILIEAGQPGEFVFLIYKGEVAELDPGREDTDARIGYYTIGDLFGAISILNGKSRYRFQVVQECSCYLLPKALFQRLCDDYPAFAKFFHQRLAQKAQRLTEERTHSNVTMASFMLARVSDCMREPLLVAADTSIAGAVHTLNDSHADSMLVDGVKGFGMVTKTDLLNALVMRGITQQRPIIDIANFNLITVRRDQYLFEALVAMTRYKIARVVVTENDIAAGVVELTDVLSYFSSRSHVVSLQIEHAATLDELVAASARTPELVQALMAQGVKLRFVMSLLAALNERIISKAWQFTIDTSQQDNGCLIVMGSEGRGEQILKTDQDNGLILPEDAVWPDCAQAMSEFTEVLIRLGYPPCPGNIMVSNPGWTGDVSGWQERIARWADARDGDSLMNLAILLDAKAVAGNSRLLDEVKEVLFERCAKDDLLLSYFARAALHFSTPLTLFGSLKKPQHGIDIKKGGIFPIVHGVRALALKERITATSTLERLESLVASGQFKESVAEDLGEALCLFTELRLKQQLERLEQSTVEQEDTNRLVVQQLSSLERDLLREALHIVKEFKQRLSQRFHLEY